MTKIMKMMKRRKDSPSAIAKLKDKSKYFSNKFSLLMSNREQFQVNLAVFSFFSS